MPHRRNIRGATVYAMKPHKRRPSEGHFCLSNPLSAVVFCLLTDLPSISEMAYPCTYQIVYLVTAWQYHRSKAPVCAIVCHARVRNILWNVPEHFPSGSSIPFKSITTVPTIKKCSFEIYLGRPVTKIFSLDCTCFALLMPSSSNIVRNTFPVSTPSKKLQWKIDTLIRIGTLTFV